MTDNLNIYIGIFIIIINLIPLVLKKPKYFGITIPLSLLIAMIKYLFM